MRPQPVGLLVADFNTANLAQIMRHGQDGPSVQVEESPYGQVFQTLATGAPQVGGGQLDFAVVWTQPQAVLGEIRALLDGLPAQPERLNEQVDAFCRLLESFTNSAEVVFVPTWAVPAVQHGGGVPNVTGSLSLTRALLMANSRLLQALGRVPNVCVLDTARWFETVGRNALSPRLWYSSKIPFAAEVFAAAAREIKSVLSGFLGLSRKLIVLDLDDTLWGGVAADVGWENVVLGGHHPEGEALVDFQRHLRALTRRGIVLAIVSKNDTNTALEVIDRHPEMLLRRSDFVSWRIN